MQKINKKKSKPRFRAPIPGQSLTANKPGEAPWEKPPKYADVEDVIKMYINQLSNPAVTSKLMRSLKKEYPINNFVESMMTAGSMKGTHTVQSGLLAAPVVSEYIKALADIEGIEYITSSDELIKRKGSPAFAEDLIAILKEDRRKKRKKGKDASPGVDESEGTEELVESQDMEEAPMKGLMARKPSVNEEVEQSEV
jgi:hypothetical protein